MPYRDLVVVISILTITHTPTRGKTHVIMSGVFGRQPLTPKSFYKSSLVPGKRYDIIPSSIVNTLLFILDTYSHVGEHFRRRQRVIDLFICAGPKSPQKER